MPKYRQSEQELRRHLCEQLRFLLASATSFDEGFEGEAKRLATTIRVLVHDTKHSKSLLHLLKIKGAIKMHNTAHPFDAGNLMPHQGLVVMKVEAPGGVGTSVSFTLFGEEEPYTDNPPGQPRAKVTYEPRVSAPPGRLELTIVPFNRWWEETVIKDKTGTLFRREDLVLAIANKEGGAHVDPELDEEYARLTRSHSQGWQVITEGIRQPPDNSIVAASIRQIAHELLVSIEQAFPDLWTDVSRTAIHDGRARLPPR